jgi:hypothetical protein
VGRGATVAGRGRGWFGLGGRGQDALDGPVGRVTDGDRLGAGRLQPAGGQHRPCWPGRARLGGPARAGGRRHRGAGVAGGWPVLRRLPCPGGRQPAGQPGRGAGAGLRRRRGGRPRRAPRAPSPANRRRPGPRRHPRAGDSGRVRDYLVVQTPATLRRFQETVVPGAALVDQAALERIFQRWDLGTAPEQGPAYANPTLILAQAARMPPPATPVCGAARALPARHLCRAGPRRPWAAARAGRAGHRPAGEMAGLRPRAPPHHGR